LGNIDEPQPDSFLFVLPEHGGTVRISDDDYIENAPDLIIEIAASSASKDLNPKKRAYAQNGIREYVVWRTLDSAIEWFVLRDGVYLPLAPDANGIIRSEVFPGLWLNVPAALRRDTAAILATLQEGLQSPEHARLVAELQARRTS
jgi:Uma2 family endonuclease